MKSHTERWLPGGALLAILLIVWEAAPAFGWIDPLFTSSPTRIVVAGYELIRSGEIFPDIYASATEFFWGYLAAILFGVPFGLVIGWFRRAQYFFGPLVDVLNAVPRIVFLPILVVWFGIGVWSKLAVVFLGAVIPITIAAASGVRTNEARFLRVAKSFSASNLKLFTSIILPGTVPFVFTGLKYGAGRALLGVVVGEVYASTVGVGHMISDAGNTLQTDVVFFGVLLFTITGLAINAILGAFEKHFERWRPPEPAR